jgi:hypothetical protein
VKNFFSRNDMEILLAYQSASVEHVFPRLRLVSVTLGDQLNINFYVHGEPLFDDAESMNLIDTYFGIGSYFSTEQGTYNINQIDAPNPIVNYLGECVYARREQAPLVSAKSKVYIENSVDRKSQIFFSMQRAMLNHMFPEIRSIHVRWDEFMINLIFIVDGELSANNQHSIECIRNDFINQFPEPTICKIKLIRIDFPARITEDYGPLIYSRKEYLDTDPSQVYNLNETI